MACKNDLKEIDALYSMKQTHNEIVRDVRIIYSDSGQVKSLIRAPKIVRKRNDGEVIEIFPDGVRATFYDEEERETSWLSANKGIRDDSKNKITVRDSVVLHNIEQDTLRTSELIWDEDKEIIFTDQFVKITNPREVIYSYGFRADQQFSRYEINQVKGKMILDDFEF